MIRKADLSDGQRISEIVVFGWRTAYKDIVPMDFLYKELSVKANCERFLANYGKPDAQTYVSEHGGIVDGIMKVGTSRDDDRGENEFELMAIYVDPNFIGKGIGSELIDECEEIARIRGKDEIVIWVFEKNNAARSFYEKHGYAMDGKKKVLEAFSQEEVRYRKKVSCGVS